MWVEVTRLPLDVQKWGQSIQDTGAAISRFVQSWSGGGGSAPLRSRWYKHSTTRSADKGSERGLVLSFLTTTELQRVSVCPPGGEPADAARKCDVFHGWTRGEHAWPSLPFQVTHVPNWFHNDTLPRALLCITWSVFSRYYENRTGERFSALDGRLNSIAMEIDTVSSSINATVTHVQSMYKYINIESSSCQGRLGRHTEDLQVVNTLELRVFL